MKALKAPKWGAIALSLMVLSPTFYQDSHAHFNQEISKSSKSNFRKIASDEEADDLDAKIEAVKAAKEKVAAAEAKVSEAEDKVKGLKEKIETLSGEVTTLEEEIKEIEEVQIPEIQTRKEAKEKEVQELAPKVEAIENDIKLEEEKILLEKEAAAKAKDEHEAAELLLQDLIETNADQADIGLAKKTLEEKEAQLDKANEALAQVSKPLEEFKAQKATIDQEVKAGQGELNAIDEELKNKEAELAAKKEELEKKKAQLEKARAVLEQAEKDLATAKEELEAANKELADAKENLTNKKKVTDLEEETNRQMKVIDVLKCSSSYQLASYMANDFMSYAQLSISRLLLNMNAMMSALTLQARYDALFYNHNIGQIPNINTLLGQPQSITINNYSGDFSSHNTTTPAGEDLEEMLINASENGSNPFDGNFGKVQFHNFDKLKRVQDFSRTNFDFSNFSGAKDRKILHQNELNINTIERHEDIGASLNEIFNDFA
jgi:myosin heavy subunit